MNPTGWWRPISALALVFTGCVSIFFQLEAPPALWTAITAFITVYGAGRSAEKAVELWKSKQE